MAVISNCPSPSFCIKDSTAQTKATQSGKQYRIVDEDGNLMDLFYP
jgi:hypothetical protein